MSWKLTHIIFGQLPFNMMCMTTDYSKKRSFGNEKWILNIFRTAGQERRALSKIPDGRRQVKIANFNSM